MGTNRERAKITLWRVIIGRPRNRSRSLSHVERLAKRVNYDVLGRELSRLQDRSNLLETRRRSETARFFFFFLLLSARLCDVHDGDSEGT